MKGVSPLLSYATMFVIGIFAASLILFSISNILNDLEKRSILSEMDYVIENIRKEILVLYFSNVNEGKVNLSIPTTIADKKYLIEFLPKRIRMKINFKGEILEKERKVNITANLSGISYPPASIYLKRNQNVLMKLI